MSMTLLHQQLKKQIIFLSIVLFAVYTTVTFVARLCNRNEPIMKVTDFWKKNQFLNLAYLLNWTKQSN
jgi:hypothetical protein